MLETDSKQVPWGKDEKDFEKRVKSVWTRWKESGWKQLCIVRLSLAMVMPYSTNANVAMGFDSDACGASCFVCHYMLESGDNSWDMVDRLWLFKCLLQCSLFNRKFNTRLCWLTPGRAQHMCAVSWECVTTWHCKLWLNCSIRPVLKHGPRSLTHV